MFIDFREVKGEKEKHQCERETSIGCLLLYMPLPVIKPTPRYVPWPGIEPTTFWYTGQHPDQLSHLARVVTLTFAVWGTTAELAQISFSFFKSLCIEMFLPQFLVTSAYNFFLAY